MDNVKKLTLVLKYGKCIFLFSPPLEEIKTGIQLNLCHLWSVALQPLFCRINWT